jgi:hypothetical protein
MYAHDSPGTQRARSEFTYHDVVDDDTSNVEQTKDDLLVLAGIEAQVVTRRSTRVQEKARIEGPKRPETSKEFAARMRDRFVLRGPAERKEGGSTERETTPDDAAANAQPNQASMEVSAHGNLPNTEHDPDLVISRNMDNVSLFNQYRITKR